MKNKADVYRVVIRRNDSDDYSIDIGFIFTGPNGFHYEVNGITASPDIFEIKANTLLKILSRNIDLPRTLDFGLHSIGGRYVHFRFCLEDSELILHCDAFDRLPTQSNNCALSFDVPDRKSQERLLEGIQHLSATPNGTFTWSIAESSPD